MVGWGARWSWWSCVRRWQLCCPGSLQVSPLALGGQARSPGMSPGLPQSVHSILSIEAPFLMLEARSAGHVLPCLGVFVSGPASALPPLPVCGTLSPGNEVPCLLPAVQQASPLPVGPSACLSVSEPQLQEKRLGLLACSSYKREASGPNPQPLPAPVRGLGVCLLLYGASRLCFFYFSFQGGEEPALRSSGKALGSSARLLSVRACARAFNCTC